MPELDLYILSFAFALAFLAGVNLYLTVFLAGLAGRMGWLPMLGDNSVLEPDPAVMTVAALLYLLGAVVDKIPVVDSLWDLLHSVIRPAGAVVLTLGFMGNADPGYQVLAGVLAGMTGLTTHLAKSAARLRINNSPGPMSNILASIGEDLLVVGLFALTVYRPVAGLVVNLSLTVVLWLMFPRMFRSMRASLFLMWKKVRLPAGVSAERVKLPSKISAEQDMLVHGELSGSCTVLWAVRCVTGRIRRFSKLKPNIFGVLISVKEHPGSLVFLGRRWLGYRPVKLLLAGCAAQHESGFLSEDLVIYNKEDRLHIVFRFTRAEQALAARIEEEWHSQQKRTMSPGQLPELFTETRETEARRAEEKLSLPPVIAPLAAPPLVIADTNPFVASPISPFPAPGETAVFPLPPLTPLPAMADVPPMPATGERVPEEEPAAVS